MTLALNTNTAATTLAIIKAIDYADYIDGYNRAHVLVDVANELNTLSKCPWYDESERSELFDLFTYCLNRAGHTLQEYNEAKNEG